MAQRCLLILLAARCLLATEIEIQTNLGNVTGTVSMVDNVQVNVFKGIPYAKPPTDDLRFAKPKEYGKFPGGTLNATEFGNICPQLSVLEAVGDEDCLFLNVYAPKTVGTKSVMIWIHGGGFRNGKSNDYSRSILAANQDVIIVTINYRVTAFGFLTTGDSRIPGNYGLWDQRLAIQWVKDNIEDYGGDSSSITLFGESAGGRSIGFQLMTPLNNRDLFQRAITESGSSLSLTYINREPMVVTETVAQNVDCDAASPELMQCLRSKSTAELLTATKGIDRPFPFFPIVDNDFLPYDLGVALANFTKDNSIATTTKSFGNFASFDLFSGWNNQEGLIYMDKLLFENIAMTGNDLSQGVSEEVLASALSKYPFYNYPQSSELKDLVIDFYINYYMSTPHVLASENRSIEDRRVEVYSRVAGNVVIMLPTIQHLQLHNAANSGGQTYAYQFNHKRKVPKLGMYLGPRWLRYGATHTDEIDFVLGNVLLPNQIYTNDEKQLSRDMMKIWTDFAKTGNPGAEFDKFQYPREQYYTVLNTGGFEKEKYPLNDVQRIWSAMDASLLKLDHPDVTRAAETEKEGTQAMNGENSTEKEITYFILTQMMILGLVVILAFAFGSVALASRTKKSLLQKQGEPEC